jgi:formylglycine-generating enzyme required for sulfatase activity
MPTDPLPDESPPRAGPVPATRPDADPQNATAAPGTAPGGIVLAAGARPLPEYELVRRLGQGGFGEVWLARGPGDFEVALKFVRLGEQAGAVELRALELMKDVRHAYLLAMFGAWQREGWLIVAMERADRSLFDRLREALQQGHGGIPRDELLQYMGGAARGLDFLNTCRDPAGGTVGIQHKDVKPQNLLLVGGHAKVADFGLAKVLEHTVTAASGGMTPAYAAPEFLKGQATRWSDQYSLAVTYCQLRGGELPFTGNHAQVLTGHLMQPPDLTMLPPAERPAVARALAKEPAQRWPSCRDFVDALQAGAGGAVPPQTPAPIEQASTNAGSRRQRGRVPTWEGVVAGVLIALLAVGTVLVGMIGRRPGPAVAQATPRAAPPTVAGPGPARPTRTAPKTAPVTRPGGPGKGGADDQRREAQRKAEQEKKELAAREKERRDREEQQRKEQADRRAALERLEARAAAHLRYARRLMDRGEADQAAEHLRVVVDLFPDTPSAAAARLLLREQQAAAARRDREAVQRTRPPPLDCAGENGVRAADVRKAQEAWAKYLGRKVEETVEIGPGVAMTFVLVPPGKFRMGSPADEKGRHKSETLHTVTLTEPFDLAKTELTQAQYRALTGKDPSQFKGDRLPVETVSWEEARDYAEQLTKKRDDKHRYRLPTEAEWEYACRGGRPCSMPFGVGDGRSLSSREANFNGYFPYGDAPKGKYVEKTRDVGSYDPNALGLYDLHGNVWEWCADRYAPYPAGEVTNPTGPPVGPSRVIRGGGWYNCYARDCRAAGRSGGTPDGWGDSIGFRLARSLPPGGK